MKLLLVFVSALVLVQGNVSPSVEEDSVYDLQSEVAGLVAVAGQEADDVAAAVQAFGAEVKPSDVLQDLVKGK